MSDHMERLGRAIRAAESKGPARFVTGVTTTAPVARRISVQVAGAIIPAIIPGSFRGNLAAGQDVRLSVQGSTYTVDSILSALTTPTVAAAPSASGISPLDMVHSQGFSAAGFSSAGFTSQDFQCALYAEYVKDDLNDTIDVVNNHQSDIISLKATVNDLRTTLVAVRAALIAQGHIV